VFFVWVTFGERKWSILAERRGSSGSRCDQTSLRGAKIVGFGPAGRQFFGKLRFVSAFSGDFLVQMGVGAVAAPAANALYVESTTFFGGGGFVW